MIPNIENGASFRGAGAYYLHDKAADPKMPKELKPTTSERVGFIETRNLANDDMAAALDEMWSTAADAPRLKKLAGHKAGRPLEKPVKTISLSWHPDQQPTRDDKVQAADAFLAYMGWAEHQAVIIEHNDTAHAHVHIIINRVHPESGLTLDDGNDQRRSQKWAHAYELEHGKVWCIDRDKKYREGGDHTLNPQGMPHDYTPAAKAAEATFAAAETKLATHDRLHERDQLSERHKAERDEFFAANKAYVKAIRQEVYGQVAGEWRDTWREHYQFAKEMRGEARSLATTEHLRAQSAIREQDFDRARSALDNRDAYLSLTEDMIIKERASLRAEQRADTKERQNEAASAFINDRYAAYDALQARQLDERHEVKALQTARAKGRPFDVERLEVLLAPHQPATEPDPQTSVRIARILDSMATRNRADSTGTDPMSQYDALNEEGTRAEERRRNLAEMAQRRAESEHRDAAQSIDRTVRAGHAQNIDKLQEMEKAQHAESVRDQATKARLEIFAREQEEAAKRAREIDAITEQQKADSREAAARADTAFIRSAESREAEALGRCYDPANPYRSKAIAVAHEHEMFIRERDHLRQQIGAETNADKRALLQMTDQIMGYEYAAHLFNRAGQLSEIVTGRSAETAQERAAREATLDPAARAALEKYNRADRISDAQREMTTGQQGNEDARSDYAVRDKLNQQAAEVRERKQQKEREMEFGQLSQGRAAQAVSEQQVAYTMATQADRTQTADTQAGRTTTGIDPRLREVMDRRREAANFTTATREATPAQEKEGQPTPAGDAARAKPKQRERDDGMER